MFAKMGVAVAVLMLALPGCREIAPIAGPEADKVSDRSVEIVHPQTGSCLTCGHCVRVCWRAQGTVGVARTKIEAWYGSKRTLLGSDLLDVTTFDWQLPEAQINDVRLRVTVMDDRGKVGASETTVSLVAPRHQGWNLGKRGERNEP